MQRDRIPLIVLLTATACHPSSVEPRAGTAPPGPGVQAHEGIPSVASIIRKGDPRQAVAVAVTTEGILDVRGAEVAVALGAILEMRMRSSGFSRATVVAGWNGYRLRTFIDSDAEGAAFARAARLAMLTPVGSDAATLSAVRRKLAALAKRPLTDPILANVVRCTGAANAPPGPADTDASATPAILEQWRSDAHRVDRVAFATTGSDTLADATTHTLVRDGKWPAAASRDIPPELHQLGVSVYDGSGEIAPGGARITLVLHTARASDAVSLASTLGERRSAFASRLKALDAPATLQDVTATAHRTGGCLAVGVSLTAADLVRDQVARIATVSALARQELLVERNEAASAPQFKGGPATIPADDPLEAADRAAWWTLSQDAPPYAPSGVGIWVGLAPNRDAPLTSSASTQSRDLIDALDRTTQAWQQPVIERRSRIETGQGQLWVLLASPCGNFDEGERDAGVTALAIRALAQQGALSYANDQVDLEEWITPDGVGLLAHAALRPGESATGHARRVADVVARAFAADALDTVSLAHARASGPHPFDRAPPWLAVLANAAAPGHPSWVSPWGDSTSLGRISDDAIRSKVGALRAGPLRLAILANDDAAQVDVVSRSADRWVVRRSGESRVCPALAPLATARSGTLAVEGIARNEVWIAFPIPSNDVTMRDHAPLLAAALDGTDGLLAKSIGDRGLARAWESKVIGSSRVSLLVLRIIATPGATDDATTQTRALLDRIRQGALSGNDFDRANARRAETNLNAALNPRTRITNVWQGIDSTPRESASTLGAWRQSAAALLRESSMIVLTAP